jgi:hypothetical protein
VSDLFYRVFFFFICIWVLCGAGVNWRERKGEPAAAERTCREEESVWHEIGEMTVLPIVKSIIPFFNIL